METLIFLIVLLALIPFVAFSLATRNLFFTKINSGDIKFAMKGDSLAKTIHDVRGKKLLDSGEFTDGIEKKSFFNKQFGLWWIGIPPFNSIHSFRIKKEKENPAGSKPEEWITIGEETLVSSLRYSFPRPFVFRNVELKDRTTVDLLAVCKFEVVNPYKLVFIFKGDFFDNTGSMLNAKVNDEVKKFDNIGTFINENKSEEDGFLKGLKEHKGPFNLELVNLIGLRLVGVNISKYDPSDKNVLEATNKEAIAKLTVAATIATAEGYVKRVALETGADQDRMIKLAKGREAQIEATVSKLQLLNADPNVIIRAVADILRTEAVASDSSKITTWVDGSNAQIVVPVGGSK